MTRKLRLFPLALVLLAAACAPPPPPNLAIQTSSHWFTNTVDSYLDAGRSASISVDSDGLPHLTYLSLNQKLAKGQIAPARPLTLPLIPAVMTAGLSKDGIWEHGDVIATEEVAKPLKLTTADAAASTVDADGNQDVAFTETGDLLYSTASSSGSFSDPEKITSANPVGLSITATSDGTPWVTWLEGAQLMAATKTGKNWSVQSVASLARPAADPERTDAEAHGDTVVIAYTDAFGSGPMLATGGPGGFTTQPIDPGRAGYGISVALDKDGNPHVAYYTSHGEVRHAHSVAGSPWEVTPIARTGTSPDPGWSASIALDGKGTHYVAWYDAKQNDVHLATNASGKFEQLAIATTENGADPEVAVAGDGSQVYVAYYDSVNLDLLMGDYVVNGSPQLAVANPPVITAPSGSAGPPAATCKPTGTTVSVEAPAGAAASGFDSKCYAAPAGQAFTINFDNKDGGVPHNFAVYDAQGGKFLFGAEPTQIITGPGTATYKVSSEPAGTYYFQCDVHPTSMFGTFVVK